MRLTWPVARSFTYSSKFVSVSPVVRLVASERKATLLPSAGIAGFSLSALPLTPLSEVDST